MDEINEVTIEQLATYTAFLKNQSIPAHFTGLLPINKEVGAHLSAVNIMLTLENFFVKYKINLQQVCLVCVDTTNVNSGEKNGLKRHIEHKVLLLK